MPYPKQFQTNRSPSIGPGLVFAIAVLLVLLLLLFCRKSQTQPTATALCVKNKDGNLQCIVDNSQVQDPLRGFDKFDIALTNLYQSQGVDGILMRGMTSELQSHEQSAANITKAAEQKMPLIKEQTVVETPYTKIVPEVNNQSNISNNDRQEMSSKTGGNYQDVFKYGGFDTGNIGRF